MEQDGQRIVNPPQYCYCAVYYYYYSTHCRIESIFNSGEHRWCIVKHEGYQHLYMSWHPYDLMTCLLLCSFLFGGYGGSLIQAAKFDESPTEISSSSSSCVWDALHNPILPFYSLVCSYRILYSSMYVRICTYMAKASFHMTLWPACLSVTSCCLVPVYLLLSMSAVSMLPS